MSVQDVNVKLTSFLRGDAMRKTGFYSILRFATPLECWLFYSMHHALAI